MKKIKLLVLLVFSCIALFAQRPVTFLEYPSSTTSFGKILPQGTRVLVKNEGLMLSLDSIFGSDDNIDTVRVYNKFLLDSTYQTHVKSMGVAGKVTVADGAGGWLIKTPWTTGEFTSDDISKWNTMYQWYLAQIGGPPIIDGGDSLGIANHIIAWYEMDEGSDATTMVDSHVNNLDGQVIGVTTGISGAVDSSYVFISNDSTDFVRIPYDPLLNLTSEFTIVALVKAEYTGSTQEIISLPADTTAFGSPYYSYGFHILNNDVTGGNARGFINTSAGFRNTGNISIPYDDDFHLVAITYNGTRFRIWLDDGTQQNETNYSTASSPVSYTNNVYIGKTGYDVQFFNGTLDNVIIADTCFTDTQLLGLYNNGNFISYSDAISGLQFFTVSVSNIYLNSASSSNSGHGIPTSRTYSSGSTCNVSTEFSNSGANFVGFYMDALGTTPASSFTVDGNYTIYAIYDYTEQSGGSEDFGTNGDYFVSSSTGSDTNAGTTSSPWASIDKVNSQSFPAGTIIKFKAGDSWAGTLTPPTSGTSGSPIVYGAYGTGEKPKIYGSEEITGWSVYSGNIYKATFNTDINQIFIDGERMRLARYPNAGYHTITGVTSTTVFTSTDLDAGTNYANATFVGRTEAWAMDTKTVASSSSQTITLSSSTVYSISTGEGFFLCNKLEFLDQAGEWYYDSGSNTVYLWTPNGDTPANYEVRGSTIDYGVSITSKNYITLENLEIAHNASIAINTDYCSNLTIYNVDIDSPDSKGVKVNHNTFGYIGVLNIDGANHIGIEANTSYSTIEYNNITNIGLFDNLGKSGQGGVLDGTAIWNTAGTSNTIRYNRINSVGYNGIRWNSTYSTISKNYLKNTMLVKQDGGAIYTWSSDYANSTAYGSTVTNNIILYSYGTKVGYTSDRIYGYGIYLDGKTRNVKVTGNTVAHCGNACIYVHNSGEDTIQNNTFFDARYVMYLEGEYGNSVFENNISLGLDRDHESFTTTKNAGQRLSATAIYTNNTYINHYATSDPIRFRNEDAFTNFATWQSSTSQDSGSTFDSSAHAGSDYEEIFVNPTDVTKTFYLNGATNVKDITGSTITTSFTIPAFGSKIVTETDLNLISE